MSQNLYMSQNMHRIKIERKLTGRSLVVQLQKNFFSFSLFCILNFLEQIFKFEKSVTLNNFNTVYHSLYQNLK